MKTEWTIHPFADLFPSLSEEAYRALFVSIHDNGLRERIVIDAGTQQVLDGRHRFRVCLELGTLGDDCVREMAFPDDDARLRFVLDANLHRRHLNDSQRALVGARLATMTQGRRADIGEISQAQAAKLMNVSTRSIQRAKQLLRRNGDIESILSGERRLGAFVETGDHVSTIICLPATLHAQLAQASQQEGTSQSRIVTLALENFFAEVVFNA